MGTHRDFAPVRLAAALPEIANQFLARVELRAGWLITIKIAHQANTQGDVVQIIAVHVTAIDLASPPVAHFDLTVTCGGSIADNKMVSEAILHPPDMPMIVIEGAGISLSGTAIMHDDELPAATLHRRASDGFNDRSCKVAIISRGAAGPRPETKSARRWRGRRLESLVFFNAGFFDQHLRSVAA